MMFGPEVEQVTVHLTAIVRLLKAGVFTRQELEGLKAVFQRAIEIVDKTLDAGPIGLKKSKENS